MNDIGKRKIDLIKRIWEKIVSGIFGVFIYSVSLRLLFPVFMRIIAIQWPEWVIIHSRKLGSWFIVLLTVNILIEFVMPTITVRHKKEEHNET